MNQLFTAASVTKPRRKFLKQRCAGYTKTKMVTFSHIYNVSGIALLAREICQMAKAKGILSLVDGAQSLGFMDLNLKEIGCDFYTSSTHKWLMGSMENGILYASKAQMEKL